MIFKQLDNYQGYKFVNVESNQEEIEQEIITKQKYKKDGIPEKELVGFTEWLKNELTPAVNNVKISQRLQNYPAIIIGDLPSSVR